MTRKHNLFNFSDKHQMGLLLKVKIDRWYMPRKPVSRGTLCISVGALWQPGAFMRERGAFMC